MKKIIMAVFLLLNISACGDEPDTVTGYVNELLVKEYSDETYVKVSVTLDNNRGEMRTNRCNGTGDNRQYNLYFIYDDKPLSKVLYAQLLTAKASNSKIKFYTNDTTCAHNSEKIIGIKLF